MKSYTEWKEKKKTEEVISEIDFSNPMAQALRQGGVNQPGMMRNMMRGQYANPEAELDAILAQSIVPLKQFVFEHPELLNLISSKLSRLWMNIKSGTTMAGRPGMVARRMDRINQI